MEDSDLQDFRTPVSSRNNVKGADLVADEMEKHQRALQTALEEEEREADMIRSTSQTTLAHFRSRQNLGKLAGADSEWSAVDDDHLGVSSRAIVGVGWARAVGTEPLLFVCLFVCLFVFWGEGVGLHPKNHMVSALNAHSKSTSTSTCANPRVFIPLRIGWHGNCSRTLYRARGKTGRDKHDRQSLYRRYNFRRRSRALLLRHGSRYVRNRCCLLCAFCTAFMHGFVFPCLAVVLLPPFAELD